MKLNTILTLAIGWREYANLDPKDPVDADIIQSIKLFPDHTEACVMFTQVNGNVHLWRVDEYRKSTERNVALRREMETFKADYDGRKAAWQAAFDILKAKVGADKAYLILEGIDRGEFPQLAAKFKLSPINNNA
jgi:hypothetical protein